MEALTVKELYTLDETIAKDIFEGVTYPWEVLPKISSFILELGKTLDENEYEKRGENVWIARSAKVAPTAYINGPAIIGKEAEVRHCAFIRGNAIVGEGAVVGNSMQMRADQGAVLMMTRHAQYIDADRPFIRQNERGDATLFHSLSFRHTPQHAVSITVTAAPSPGIIQTMIDEQHLPVIPADDPGRGAQMQDGVLSGQKIIKTAKCL